MPHKRKSKNCFSPKLQFEPNDSFLYLTYYEEEENFLCVPIESLVIIFSLKFCEIKDIKIRFVVSPISGVSTRISKQLDLHFEIEKRNEAPVQVQACRLPAWFLPNQRTCIAGLCSVVRYAFRLAHFSEQLQICKSLLGFQQGCLSAPQEVSTWTKFCEVDIHQPLEELNNTELITLPEAISKFEAHLKQPVRMHNIRDKMQKSGKVKPVLEDGIEVVIDNGEKVDPIEVYARTEHVFAEGPELLISDVLIYPIFYLLEKKYKLLHNFPNIETWYVNVSETNAASVMDKLVDIEEDLKYSNLPAATVPEESLYKCDPNRNKQSAKLFTRQADIDTGLDWWDESGITNMQQYQVEGCDQLDWSELPKLVHPLAGSLPPDRLERKCGQLSSLAVPLAKIAKPGDVLVDFCSGGGHLGLLVAHLAPSSTVHMVENKEESLARARERGVEMGANNVWFFQCNLEYYIGTFNIGSSLHACGVATDLVILKCTQARAAFVCCPCCYGGVQCLDNVTYPRSQLYASAGVGLQSYLVLAHAADQTHAGVEKCEQGRLCMDIVDTDRGWGVREQGYSVTLSKLEPRDCTPKNNLLVGIPS